MLPISRPRRRPRHGAFMCAVFSALLLLLFLSLSMIYRTRHPRFLHHDFNYDSLLSDSVNDDASSGSEDTIDALDVLEDQIPPSDDADEDEDPSSSFDPIRVSGFFFYHIGGAIRKAFFGGRRSPEEWNGEAREIGIFSGDSSVWGDDRSKAAFASDDVPVEEGVRRKVVMVSGVEDALLLKMGPKVSPLREGWGDWFDKKGDFLRKDKMLRSNLEGLHPLHNPILQDPDGVGYTGLTKGDKVLHKAMLNEFKRVPFFGRKIQESKVQQGTSRHG